MTLNDRKAKAPQTHTQTHTQMHTDTHTQANAVKTNKSHYFLPQPIWSLSSNSAETVCVCVCVCVFVSLYALQNEPNSHPNSAFTSHKNGSSRLPQTFKLRHFLPKKFL
ncbi:unnamed protein product [Boreogadus saida]